MTRRLPRLLGIPGRGARVDVDDELRFHIDMAAADLVARGISPEAARAEAERRFGAVTDVRDACLTIDERRRRNAATADHMSAFLNDLRYAARSLRKTPMLTIVGSLTLMLGIGAATAVFSVVDNVLLRPLPYADSDRLVAVSDGQGDVDTPLSYPEVIDWQSRATQIFDGVGAWFSSSLTYTGGDQPVALQGQRVSWNLPALLGVRPILGRSFRPEEDKAIGDRVVMLSERFWRKQFNADSTVIGRSLTLAGYPFTVIGVYPSSSRSRLPNELSSATQSDYWQGLRLDESRAPRSLHFMSAVARLRPGLTFDVARQRVKSINDQLRADSVTQHAATITDLSERVIGPSATLLRAISGAVLLVLLVACANVASLLLARGAARQREIAVRAALGASHGRILSQLLTESVLRALVGGAMGVALAYGIVEVMHRRLTVRLPRFADAGIDVRVLGFALAMALLTGVIFGLAPALRSARSDANTVMREGGRGVHGSLRRDAFRRFLVAGEIVMSCILLVGAGLLLKSFGRLTSVPTGFNPERVITASLSLPGTRYPDSLSQIDFYRRLVGQLRQIPGVTGAVVSSGLPTEGGTNGGLAVEGRTYPEGTAPIADKRFVGDGYFTVIGARIVEGRDISPADIMTSTKVAIVNQALAKKVFPGESALGKRIDLNFGTSGMQTIVGVVADVKEQGLADALTPSIYVPVAQRASSGMYVIVRGSVEPSSLVPAIRRELKAVDPSIPLDNIREIGQVIDAGITSQRLSTTLLSWFAAAALVLAAIGLYGVISYSVAQRTQEIGVRAALGAQRSELISGVMREGMTVVAGGVLVGVIAARASAQLIASQLFGVSVGDLPVYAAVAAVLTVVSAMALIFPALRASRVDPIVALREE